MDTYIRQDILCIDYNLRVPKEKDLAAIVSIAGLAGTDEVLSERPVEASGGKLETND
jgi:hypothetical protein